MTRKHRHRFRPGVPDALERRLALTHGGPITPALIGTISANPGASGRSGRLTAQVNQAFDRFTNDYLQAEGAYLSSGAPQAAFVSFVQQRVNLLGQELTRIFARLPGSFSRLQNKNQSVDNSSTVFETFLRRNINGNPPSSLLMTLTRNTVVPPQGTTGAAATLYTLTATNAIQAAQTATINAAKFIVNGTFAKH